MVGSRPDARSDYVSRHCHRHTRACPAHPRLWALCRDRLELAWSERRLPATQQGRYEKRPRARSSAEEHYLDMVGVTGSIPVAPTIKCPQKSAVSASFSEDDRASQCLN